MSLENLIKLSKNKNDENKGIITEERIKKQFLNLRRLISFFREYPDLLIDFIKKEDSTFNFFFYQRVFIRIVMRHKYVFATFARAFSKSFLSMMVLILRCILYPNSNLFVTTGGKELISILNIT